MNESLLMLASLVIGAVVGILLLDGRLPALLQTDILSLLGLYGPRRALLPRPKLLQSCFLGCFAAMVIVAGLYFPLLLKQDLAFIFALLGWSFVGFLTGIIVNLICYGFSSRTLGLLTGTGVGVGIYLLLWHTFLWWAEIHSEGTIFWMMDILTPAMLGAVTGASCGLASVVWFKRLPEATEGV